MPINVKQSMSRHPMAVRAKDDLTSAYIRMKREEFRHMPVIDDAGQLTGIISDRDFQRAMLPTGELDAHGLPAGPAFRRGAKISDYMNWPVRSLPEDSELSVAVAEMINHKISAVVVTREGQMVGILTHEDLLRVLAVLLKEPAALHQKALKFAYNSPLSEVTEFLAVAGI